MIRDAIDPSLLRAPVERFALGGHGRRRVEIWLDDSGLNYQRGGRAWLVARYADITHWGPTRRGLWLATAKSSDMLRFGARVSEAQRDRLGAALRARVRQGADASQHQQLDEVDALARSPHWRVVVPIVVLVCALMHFIQAGDFYFESIASFAPAFVALGEWWRIVTGHFVHGIFPIRIAGVSLIFPLHLLSNLLLLMFFAQLVERPLGALRTWLILVAGGLGATLGCALVGHVDVVGASGLVSALAGATLLLEYRYPQMLPAWWRIPRRLFLFVLVAQLASEVAMNSAALWAEEDGRGAWLPRIATAAHVGGFFGGWLAARVVARGAFEGRTQAWLYAPALAAVLAVVLAFASLRPLLTRDVDALSHHAWNLFINVPDDASRLNNFAWLIVTGSEAGPEDLDAALALSERAVELTQRSNPDLLDTLAEIHFGRGDPYAAIDAIDEAIDIEPMQVYFWQQRERFLGNRPKEDRPREPRLPWDLRRFRPTPPPGPELEA